MAKAKSKTSKTLTSANAGVVASTGASVTTGTAVNPGAAVDPGAAANVPPKATDTGGTAPTPPRGDAAGTVSTVPRSLAAVAPDAAMGRAFASVARALGDRAALKETARGLMSGRLTVQSVLGSLVETTAKAVEAATLEGQRAVEREALTSRQVRADLVRLQANAPYPRPRKDDYAVGGQVSYASGEPASGFVVNVIGRDVYKHDTLGAAVTDDKGTFQVLFAKTAFAESGEKTPEILLVVGTEDRPSILTTEPRRLEEGERQVTIQVTLPAGTVGPIAHPNGVGVDVNARLFRLDQRQSIVRTQHEQLSTVTQDAQLGLTALLAILQPGAPAPPAKGRSSKARRGK